MGNKRIRKKQKKKQKKKPDFFIPVKCCPERADSPELPSPESCLPPEKREEVDRKIAEANRLLLDLALDDNRSIQETYQRAFDGLIGLEVEIVNPLDETISGVVMMAAFDFILLSRDDYKIIVPYEQIESVKASGCYAELVPVANLLNIGPRLRRKLTFQFGKVVGSSPELIQLFFKIPLAVYLLLFEDQTIKVRVGRSLIEGVLVDVNKESIVLEMNKEKSIIAIGNIAHIMVGK
ncbi:MULTISPECIES: hypothetical protein [unclassified Sporosarcina]|uniref:hypothetical protein n=1 Tax=unclassified Sporosarcina TaxID=2647733 RepID=UPI000C163532|nr:MULTISPECIES: hypothetical protein [unclassified Sporosarcina]PID00892.1 hypothetical protein CSV68_01325 [Sporosarcina sp. P29]PID07050.1 hypothetical protein CSV66_00245 [Sporosarcina sp. P30]PID10246.1 hypothetical protein CSV65_00250 [Sporosarcina sp. P31]PID12144.1 hypothetical protein CSV64_08245 [Sporosarcina sp. P32b]